jgi:hypothetical protein
VVGKNNIIKKLIISLGIIDEIRIIILMVTSLDGRVILPVVVISGDHIHHLFDFNFIFFIFHSIKIKIFIIFK